jgi:hypothetical protein
MTDPAPAPQAPAPKIQVDVQAMARSPEGLLVLASVLLIAAWALFSVLLNVDAMPWESLVAAALILAARYLPASPAAGLNTRTSLFVLGFVIFAFAVLSLVWDARNFRSSYDAMFLVGELVHFAAGALAGLGLWRMMR